MEAKTTTKKHSFRLLMAMVFVYHHYECFGSQIELTNLTIVKGEPDNSQNKNARFLNAVPLKMYIFFLLKNTQK